MRCQRMRTPGCSLLLRAPQLLSGVQNTRTKPSLLAFPLLLKSVLLFHSRTGFSLSVVVGRGRGCHRHQQGTSSYRNWRGGRKAEPEERLASILPLLPGVKALGAPTGARFLP